MQRSVLIAGLKQTPHLHTHTNELAPLEGSCAVGRLHLWNKAEFPPSLHAGAAGGEPMPPEHELED